MAANDIARLVRDLSRVVDRERIAILTGDLKRLGRLTAGKAELMGRISECEDLDAADYADLKRKFDRNQVLLEHAMAGVRSVSDRLNALQSAQGAMTVYDGKGCATTFGPGKGPTVVRRA